MLFSIFFDFLRSRAQFSEKIIFKKSLLFDRSWGGYGYNFIFDISILQCGDCVEPFVSLPLVFTGNCLEIVRQRMEHSILQVK